MQNAAGASCLVPRGPGPGGFVPRITKIHLTLCLSLLFHLSLLPASSFDLFSLSLSHHPGDITTNIHPTLASLLYARAIDFPLQLGVSSFEVHTSSHLELSTIQTTTSHHSPLYYLRYWLPNSSLPTTSSPSNFRFHSRAFVSLLHPDILVILSPITDLVSECGSIERPLLPQPHQAPPYAAPASTP
ncbi:hypothetical protein FZEAL_8895 [Fusarium zealandicum]|uniref:Uncharacterized protein n=1 Tax=Fusarium zealandicum TaxID=1053134 RepID=A0A8H4XH78_9HYPO|nr:hypothetical protein FZEAL_8895 [Fusarium zealandicum]